MKKTTSLLIAISVSLILNGQAPGTLDSNFGKDGTFSYSITGQELMSNFISVWEGTVDDQPIWKILAGGNLYKNFMNSGIFLMEYNSDGSMVTWDDSPTNGFVSLQNGIYMPNGNIMIVGNAQFDGPFLAAVAQMTVPGEFDTNYGNQGVLVVDQNGPSYIYGACLSQTKTDNPFIMLGGAGSKGDWENERAWWKMDTQGNLIQDFGTNGRLMPSTHASSAWVWEVMPVGDLIGSAGSFDSRAIFSVFDASGQQLSNQYYPVQADPDLIADYFTFNFDDTHYYACGYTYNTSNDASGALITCLNRETFETDNNRYGGFTPALSGIVERYGGYLTGVSNLFPSTRYSTQALKSEQEHPMILVGSIMTTNDHEASFIAAINEDGSLADDFADNGSALIDFEGSNWPLDAVMLKDGSFFVAINEYEVNKTHILKFYGFTDLTGMKAPKAPIGKIRVFPTPARELLNIDLKWENQAEVFWCIQDLSGKRMDQGLLHLNEDGSGLLHFDTSQYPSGNYLFTARSQDHIQNAKFIIL